MIVAMVDQKSTMVVDTAQALTCSEWWIVARHQQSRATNNNQHEGLLLAMVGELQHKKRKYCWFSSLLG